MECMSCQATINPKWKFAIENNSCPCCGQQIMEQELKDLLSSLSSSFDKLNENYAKQLDHWMLHNFNYIKTDSPELINYVPKHLLPVKEKIVERKVSSEFSEEEDSEVVKPADPEAAAKFFKNAGVEKQIKRTDELKQLVQKIKTDNPQLSSTVIPESEEDYEQEYNDSYVEEIPSAVLAFANQGSKPSATYSSKDMFALQKLNEKSIEARRNVVNGGRGAFSRSG